MSEVSGTAFNGPDLDGVGNGIGSDLIHTLLTLQRANKGLVDGLGQVLGHLLTGKDVLAENLRDRLDLTILLRKDDVTRSLGEGLNDSVDTSLMSHIFFLEKKEKKKFY
jgi:hypothetical protein